MHEREPNENIHLVHKHCSDQRKTEFQSYLDRLMKEDKLQKDFATAVFSGKAFFKAGIKEGGTTENMWFCIHSVDFVEGTFKGRLDNDPVLATSYRFGQVYTLPLSSVLDKLL